MPNSAWAGINPAQAEFYNTIQTGKRTFSDEEFVYPFYSDPARLTEL